MGNVTTLLDSLDETSEVSVDFFGGVDAILADTDLPFDERGYTVVGALCREWSQLHRHVELTALVNEFVSSPDPYLVGDVLDIVLASAEALPQLAPPLVETLRTASREVSLRAEIALEAWVRLAIGGWSRGLEVRGRLDQYVHELVEQQSDPSPYVVRALGAALDMWGDDDLYELMRALSETEAADDAAMELGVRSLALATSAAESEAASVELREAAEWFEIALSYGHRPDADVFSRVTALLRSFVAAERVDPAVIDALRAAVGDYLSGFIGLVPHWRQPRAESALRWFTLMSEFEALNELDDAPWLDAGAVIAAVGRVLASSRTLRVVSFVGAGSGDGAGSVRLVRPRLVSGFAAVPDAVRQLEKWSAANADTADDVVLAEIDSLRERLLERGDAPPKAEREPGGTGLPDRVRETLRLSEASALAVERAIDAEPALIVALEQSVRELAPLTVAEEDQVEAILADIHAIHGGKPPVSLRAVVVVLVQFAADTLNLTQSGETAPEWLGPDGASKPESRFSNDLRSRFQSLGLKGLREVPDVAGGRTDVFVQVGKDRYVVEAKRVSTHLSFDRLVAKFGLQAVQYQATDVPYAFLAVVDYFHQPSRTDLTGCFDTRQFELPGSSRIYSLTTMRVQANVATPSRSH